LKYDKVDAIFCPGNISPIFTKVKTVQWIGTIGPFFKDFYSNFNLLIKIKLYLNKIIMSLSAQHADAVIFESIFTKDLFINNYKIKPEKTHVLNIGKDVFFNPNGSNNKNPFLLCVSHLYPYKNILNMLEAYSKSLKMAGEKIDLIIAGSIDYKEYYFEIQKVIKRLSIGDNVHFLGKVSKKELNDLYSNCELMIFPSPFENFAYTLVEAMSCGSPIICSNTTAMPETCQEAAIYFDPYDIEDMARKISLLISDKDLRQSLRKKSIDRSLELPDYSEVTIETLKIIESQIE
jgi:glycosyltransferase involved in cell wall biosynthesis